MAEAGFVKTSVFIENMSLRPFRLLIVGAGLTGAVTASLISKDLSSQIEIHVWEKSRGVGGRMTTNRAPDGLSSVDLGAQYITRTRKYGEKHENFFKDLIQAGVLKPFAGVIDGEIGNDDQLENFMAPEGINSVVKHFFSTSGAHIKTKTFCNDISLSSVGNTVCWRASTNEGTSEEFHGIIVTIPVPQILKLGGTFQECFQEFRSSLDEVQYSSRYALALYFPKGTNFDVSWTAKYIKDNPCIRFVSIDSTKRGKGFFVFGKRGPDQMWLTKTHRFVVALYAFLQLFEFQLDSNLQEFRFLNMTDFKSSGATLLVHTSVPFGLKHLEMNMNEVEDIIYRHFQELFPGFPPPSTTRCIRWRYSQVHKPFPGQPGALVVHKKPLLVLAGDAFVHSNFSGCIESSLIAFEQVQKHIRAFPLS